MIGYRHLKTITLETAMTFAEALQGLKDGKYIGIRPGQNANYITLYTPKWQRIVRRDAEPDHLCWRDDSTDDPNTGIRASQFLEEWFGVILDHRSLERNEAGMVKMKFPIDSDGDE